MASKGKPTKPTFLAPGILTKSKKSANRLIPSFLSGFSSEGGTREGSLRNVRTSSSIAAILSKQNHDGVDDGASRKEVETSFTPSNENFMPSNNEDGSTNMHLVTKDVISNFREEEANEDVNGDTSRQTNDIVLPIIAKRKKRASDAKSRGVNKCTRVANLKEGHKLQVDYFNNGPVGDNHGEMVRHMRKLVRDRTIVPVRVHSWDEIDESVKEHLWQSILNKFGSGDMDIQRAKTIDHMKRLWQNWRGLMKRDNINKKGTIEGALKDVPNHLTREDWEWLIKEHCTMA